MKAPILKVIELIRGDNSKFYQAYFVSEEYRYSLFYGIFFSVKLLKTTRTKFWIRRYVGEPSKKILYSYSRDRCDAFQFETKEEATEQLKIAFANQKRSFELQKTNELRRKIISTKEISV